MSPMKPIKRAIIYGRVSGDDRERDSLSVQLEMGREHAVNRGYVVVSELTEDERGISGATMDAPALEQALSLAGEGEYDVLVVREMDRLARSHIKQHIVERRLKQSGVDIDYVLYDFAPTPEGQLHKNILAVLAEYDRLKISERMERGRRAAVRRGNVLTAGHPPFGYQEVETTDGRRTLEPVAGTDQWARQIFEWYVRGDHSSARLSLRAVARKLEEHGVLSPGDLGTVPANKKRPPGSWNPVSVREILINPVYKGEWTYKVADGERLVVPVPPLVEREMWEAAQKRFEENKQLASRNTRYEYLLRARMTCGNCGYSFSARRTSGHLYYRCVATYRKDMVRQCNVRKMIRADRFDERVWQCVASSFSQPERLRENYEKINKLARNRDALSEIATINAEIERLEMRLVRLQHLYLDGDLDRDKYRKQRDEIRMDLNQLAKRRGSLENAAGMDDLAVLDTLESFAAETHKRILSVEDFRERMWYVDKLDLRATIGADRVASITAHNYKIGEVLCD